MQNLKRYFLQSSVDRGSNSSSGSKKFHIQVLADRISLPLIPLISKKRKKVRAHSDLNQGPIGLQPIALPLSYRPKYLNDGMILLYNNNSGA